MSGDAFYFLCLGTTVLCGLFCPAMCLYYLGRPPRAGWYGVGIATSAAIGNVAALPFGRTLEMPWWPYLVGAYFSVCLVSTVLCVLSYLDRTAGTGR